jgi:hypothetical protein
MVDSPHQAQAHRAPTISLSPSPIPEKHTATHVPERGTWVAVTQGVRVPNERGYAALDKSLNAPTGVSVYEPGSWSFVGKRQIELK